MELGIYIEPNRFYSKKEVMSILNISESTLHKRVVDGELLKCGSGRKILYKGQSIINFIDPPTKKKR